MKGGWVRNFEITLYLFMSMTLDKQTEKKSKMGIIILDIGLF